MSLEILGWGALPPPGSSNEGGRLKNEVQKVPRDGAGRVAPPDGRTQNPAGARAGFHKPMRDSMRRTLRRLF